jgi:hypothetical protein
MKIYKYSPNNQQSLENLMNYGLWFSNKFDSDEKDNNLLIGELDLDKFKNESIEFFEKHPKLFKKYRKIFEESNISKTFDEPFSVEIMMKTMKDTYHGITCFTTTETNEYMWKKFAEKHSGFCLCFDTEIDINFFKELYPVNYMSELPTIDLNNTNLAKEMESYSLSKREKYTPEDEIRLFKNSSGLHNYKKECLIEITLGKHFENKKIFESKIREKYHQSLNIKNVT